MNARAVTNPPTAILGARLRAMIDLPHDHPDRIMTTDDEFARRIATMPTTVVDAQKFEAIRRAQERLPSDASRNRSLASFARGAVVCLAGQQPALFGGPLYTSIKIASAIAAAKALCAHGIDAVPVFWNASEDHDLDEANRAYFQSSRDHSIHLLKIDDKKSGPSLDELQITADDVARLDARVAEFSESAHTDIPVPGETFAAWMSRLVATRFHGEGLLIVEPADLAPVAVDLRRRWIERRRDAAELFRVSRARRLERGQPPVLNVDLTHESGLFMRTGGRRRKITVDRDGRFLVGEHVFSDRELIDRIAAHPTDFTSAVFTRPLVQQEIFGRVLQIAGPSEILYLQEIEALFDVVEVSRPTLRLRPSLLVLNEMMRDDATRLGIDPDTLAHPPITWPVTDDRSRVAFRAALEALNDQCRRILTPPFDVVGSARDAWIAAAARARRASASVRHRFEILERRRTRTERGLRKRLEELTWPRGKPQERMLGFAALTRRSSAAFAADILRAVTSAPFGYHLVEVDR